MKFVVVSRWVFNIAAAVSLILCLAGAALWARSVRHFEILHADYNRWRQPDGLQHYAVSLAWYPHTILLSVNREQCAPKFFASFDSKGIAEYRKIFPAGSSWHFFREDSGFSSKFGYPSGFHAEHRSFRPLADDDRYLFSVRPWLPTLLAAILPAIWLIQYRRRRGVLWKLGLRELLLSLTTVAVLLGAALWLMR